MIYEDRLSTKIEKKAKKAQGATFLLKDVDSSILLTLPFEYPKGRTVVTLTTDEFTCICPFSGLPDFASLSIAYIPRTKLIELKALKYYLYAFRNVKVYNEHVINRILIDLKKILSPQELTVEAEFTIRGGMRNKVSCSYHSKK